MTPAERKEFFFYWEKGTVLFLKGLISERHSGLVFHLGGFVCPREEIREIIKTLRNARKAR